MKNIFKLSVILLIIFHLNSFAVPSKPTGRVNDYAVILNSETQSYLTSVIDTFEQKTSVEIAVVTIKTLDGETIERYAYNLYNKWGIGKKGKNNGVLFLVAIKERKMRIEVGYGLEAILTDGLCGEIRDKYIIPYFKQGDYPSGIQEGTKAIIKTVSDALGVKSDIVVNSAKKEEGKTNEITIYFIVLLIIVARIILPSRRNRGGFWGSGGFGGGSSSGGGFGGGSSGGGGASGSW